MFTSSRAVVVGLGFALTLATLLFNLDRSDAATRFRTNLPGPPNNPPLNGVTPPAPTPTLPPGVNAIPLANANNAILQIDIIGNQLGTIGNPIGAVGVPIGQFGQFGNQIGQLGQFGNPLGVNQAPGAVGAVGIGGGGIGGQIIGFNLTKTPQPQARSPRP